MANNENTLTVETDTFGLITLTPAPGGTFCWRNADGQRLGQYYTNENDALSLLRRIK